MKIFAKEPKLAKLLRELKSTPVRYYKKSTDFLVCLCVTAFFLCFGCFAAGQHVDGCFFVNAL